MRQINNHNEIVSYLSCLKSLTKYDSIQEDVFLHNKSAYVFGTNISAKIEFMERKFEKIVKIPFGENFESSDDIEHKLLSDKIAETNEECRAYCDTLFYINKYELLDFMHSNYNSIAKLNKIKLTIELNDGIKFKFTPKKKSVSVSPCEYQIDTTMQVSPNFRIEFGEISISALLLYEIINNNLLGRNVRIEINTRKGFLRASSIIENVNAKFIINKIKE